MSVLDCTDSQAMAYMAELSTYSLEVDLESESPFYRLKPSIGSEFVRLAIFEVHLTCRKTGKVHKAKVVGRRNSKDGFDIILGFSSDHCLFVLHAGEVGLDFKLCKLDIVPKEFKNFKRACGSWFVGCVRFS